MLSRGCLPIAYASLHFAVRWGSIALGSMKNRQETNVRVALLSPAGYWGSALAEFIWHYWDCRCNTLQA